MNVFISQTGARGRPGSATKNKKRKEKRKKSNMAAQSSVIISAFQLVGQKIILPFGSEISPLLKFHWPKYLPWSWQLGVGGHTEWQGNVILLQNIHDE